MISDRRPHVWIVYPWVERKERDFGYVISQLKDAGVEASWDEVQFAPGTPLWQQIVPRLVGSNVNAFACIMTAHWQVRRACCDELVTALDQVLDFKGPDFPRVNLLCGIAVQDLPPTLRMLPCISLADSNWNLQFAKSLKATPHGLEPEHQTRFTWKVHPAYGGNPEITAVEVCAKAESIQYWRFAVPRQAPPCHWGQGPSGGGDISPFKVAPVKGSGRYAHYDVAWFGAGNAVTKTESAYVLFSGRLPDFVCFGLAKTPYGPPSLMEMYWVGSKGTFMGTSSASCR